MSNLEKLLESVEVEWKALGEYVDYEQPTPYLVKSANYNDKFATPVLTAGKTFILGYTDETKGIYKASKTPVIIFDDFTTANKWVDFDFKAKSSAMKILTSKDELKANLKYIYYCLNTLPSGLVDGDHKRQWIGTYSNKTIPIPCPKNPKKSLEIQEEIVRILDKFSTLTAELQAELQARKKQYSYYREQLLSAKMVNGKWLMVNKEVVWKTLGELCKIGDGLHGTPKYNNSGEYFFINGNNLDNGKIVFNNKTNKVDEIMFKKYGIDFTNENTVFLSINGTIGSVSLYNNEKIVLGKSVAFFNIESSELTSKFLYYFLQTNYSKNYFESEKTGSTIKNLGLKALRTFSIPVPSLEEQERIVDILDKFNTLTNSITEGLPKEIELCQKQYEYYRDMLLTFPSLRAVLTPSLRAVSTSSLRAAGEAIQKNKHTKQ